MCFMATAVATSEKLEAGVAFVAAGAGVAFSAGAGVAFVSAMVSFGPLSGPQYYSNSDAGETPAVSNRSTVELLNHSR